MSFLDKLLYVLVKQNMIKCDKIEKYFCDIVWDIKFNLFRKRDMTFYSIYTYYQEIQSLC